MESRPVKRIARLPVLTLVGLAVLLICSIPVPSVEKAINTSSAVSPGSEVEVRYHTHIFGTSALKGEVVVEGEGVYLTVHGHNTRNLSSVFVKERYALEVDPAHDLYTFIFDNAQGRDEIVVRFRLVEIWTKPISFGSAPSFTVWLTGLFLFLAGIVGLALKRLRIDRSGIQKILEWYRRGKPDA